jgi:DNA gyrase subunit B
VVRFQRGFLPEQLQDCHAHWPTPGSELVIAEGSSGANALVAVRSGEWQAVLAVQGKPLNVLAATQSRVEASAPLMAIRDALGAGLGDEFVLNRRRYERVVLAFDPDADGIHSRSLLLLFLHRYMAPLLRAGAVFAARPPLWQITAKGLAGPVHAWTDGQYNDVRAQLEASSVHNLDVDRFNGVASIPPDILRATCLDPKTRVLARLTTEHAIAVMAAYERAR